MRHIIFVFTVAALLFTIPTQVFGFDVILKKEAGLEIWVPDDWNYQKQGDFLILQAPSGALSLYCYLTELQVATSFSSRLAQELSKIIEQPEVDSEKQVRQVNEFFVYEATGIGLRNGEIIDWNLSVVAGGRMSLMVVALGSTDRYRDRIENFFQNLKTMEKSPEEEEEEEEEDPDTEP